MRITEGQLRRIIREELLGETPFDDFIIPSEHPDPPKYKIGTAYGGYPAIAHPRARSKAPEHEGEKYADIVKDLMRNTKDNWVIITPVDISDRSRLETDEFNEWLRNERRKRQPGTIFAFAASAPMPGDDLSARWAIVHDLLGHTLERFWQSHGGKYREKSVVGDMGPLLHGALPSEHRISDDPGDMMPDVLAAILLGALTLERAHEFVGEQFKNAASDDETDEAHELVNHMFRDVNDWLEKARDEGFVVLAPW